MNTILMWLFRPWRLLLVVLILFSLLFWWDGPLIIFDRSRPFASATSRIVIISLLFISFAAVCLVRYRRKRALQAASTQASRATEQDDEIEQLKSRMLKAIKILRKTRFTLGRYFNQRQSLPWYLVLGAPNAGKTTLLKYSGLRFPLSELVGRNNLGNIGGTSNCDWWFTEEAIILDTTGRYTTQNVVANKDKSAWECLLKLLSKYRRLKPINGLFVVVSVKDLLDKSTMVNKNLALSFRERLSNLHEQLNINFPVYFIVSKCDLLAGFTEFFSTLGREERMQVWGITFPLLPQEQLSHLLTSLPVELDKQEKKLQTIMVERLSQEQDLALRALIFGFPQQFAAITQVLAEFVNDVFEVTQFEKPALLRGVYFTSAVQNGPPIDNIVNNVAEICGLPARTLPANEESGRSFFVLRLLREVIFKEAGIASNNLRYERNLNIARWASGIILVCATLGFFAFQYFSYVEKTDYITTTQQEVKVLKQKAQELSISSYDDILALLDEARYLRDKANNRSRLAIFNQEAKVRNSLHRTYHQLLIDLIPQLMVQHLRTGFMQMGMINSDDFFDNLRIYLMMGTPSKFDRDLMLTWFEQEWGRLPSLTDTQQKSFNRHLAEFLDIDPNQWRIALDQDLVYKVRAVISKTPRDQWVYARIKRTVEFEHIPGRNIFDLAGIEAPQVLRRISGEPLTEGIPGFYTLEGFKAYRVLGAAYISSVVRDQWVLQSEESNIADAQKSIQQAVDSLYFNDYINHWDNLLNDLDVVTFTSFDQGSRLMKVLSGGNSPIKKLALAVAKQTVIEEIDPSLLVGAKPARSSVLFRMIDSVNQKISNVMKGDEETRTTEKSPSPLNNSNPVTLHFLPLHRFVTPGENKTPPALDQFLVSFGNIGVYLDAAKEAANEKNPLPPPNQLVKLDYSSLGHLPNFNRLLSKIESNSLSITQETDVKRINEVYKGALLPFCNKAIVRRFPFSSVDEEISPDDFVKFFASGGIVDGFFQKYLSTFVDNSGEVWRWRSPEKGAEFSAATLSFFNRAAQVRQTLFAANGIQPQLKIAIRPVYLDPKISEFKFTVGAQTLVQARGEPENNLAFIVPNLQDVDKASITVQSESGDFAVTREGYWAGLRLIQVAQLKKTMQEDQFELLYGLDNNQHALLRMSIGSVNNPFSRQVLKNFSCPGSLMNEAK